MRTVTKLIILFLLYSSCAQETGCIDFKTGEFRYAKEGMPEKIVRTENIQIETNPSNKIVIKTTIEWTSDCKYVMTYSEILNHPNNVSEVIGKKIYCEIIETHENRMKVHVKSDTMDDILEFIKVN